MTGFEPVTSSLPTDKILAAQGFSQLSLYRLYGNTTRKIRQMRHTNGCCYTAFNRVEARSLRLVILAEIAYNMFERS